MDRNLALEFVRATEAAAISASAWFGKGDKNAADQSAVDAMRDRLNYIDFNGKVVIGEGDKDEAPMLYIDEKLGTGKGVEMDIAVDPLECTSNCANGRPNAISVLAASPKGCLLHAPGTYMDQICVGIEAAGNIDINAPVKENIKVVADALDKEINEVTVVVLDRPRHKQLIEDIRKAGARINLIDHGTISGGISAPMSESGIDMMVGIGGAPEAVITAAAIRCLGGDMQAVLKPHNEQFKQQAIDMGFTDIDKVFSLDELAKGDQHLFAATGISDGPLLKGVIFGKHRIMTHSIVMRSMSKTVRFIEAWHHLNK